MKRRIKGVTYITAFLPDQALADDAKTLIDISENKLGYSTSYITQTQRLKDLANYIPKLIKYDRGVAIKQFRNQGFEFIRNNEVNWALLESVIFRYEAEHWHSLQSQTHLLIKSSLMSKRHPNPRICNKPIIPRPYISCPLTTWCSCRQ